MKREEEKEKDLEKEEKLSDLDPGPERIKLKSWKDVLESEEPPLPKEEQVTADFAKRYPPWKDAKIYVLRWNDYINEVAGRSSFRSGDLAQLDILCSLYVEADRLERYLNETGYMYSSEGKRNGFQLKPNPTASLLYRTRSDIKMYLKILGLIPNIDEEETGSQRPVPPSIEDEWK